MKRPVVVTNPTTGRRALFLSQLRGGSGRRAVDPCRADEVEALTAHVTSRRFVYEHHWQVGDIVMWDQSAWTRGRIATGASNSPAGERQGRRSRRGALGCRDGQQHELLGTSVGPLAVTLEDRSVDLQRMLDPHSTRLSVRRTVPEISVEWQWSTCSALDTRVEYCRSTQGETSFVAFPVSEPSRTCRGRSTWRFSQRLAPRLSAFHECAEAGISRGVVWGGGFAEVGGRGIELQLELGAACESTGFRMLGPNCIGFINSKESVTATFASFLSEEERLLPGTISMVTQSGGLGTMVHALAQRASVGLRYMISTGNEVSLTACDFIEALVDDDGTSVICCYLKGVSDGEHLQRALSKAQQARKPIVVLKGGLRRRVLAPGSAHGSACRRRPRVARGYSASSARSWFPPWNICWMWHCS